MLDKMTQTSLAHCKQTIKVAPARTGHRRAWMLLVLLLLVTVFFWLFGGFRRSASSSSNPTIRPANSSGALQMDLSALQKLRHQTRLIALKRHLSQLAFKHKLSKQWLFRENAPTLIYQRNVMSPAAHAHPSGTGTLFAGKGAEVGFANQHSAAVTVQASRLPYPGYTLAAGELLPAILETAIQSDIVGMVRAVISRPVYAYQGRRVLIPAGTRVIGQYQSVLTQGVNRIMIIWNRLILPNGITATIDSPSTGPLGMAGQQADHVNHHFWLRFGQAALLSLLGAGAATSGNNSTGLNSADLYRQSIAQSFQQSASASLSQTQMIKPTLRVYQGAMINIFVNRDVSFYRVLHQPAEPAEPAQPAQPAQPA